jgi:hypothetical protein
MENLQITSSGLDKNQIQKLCFFLDDATVYIKQESATIAMSVLQKSPCHSRNFLYII